MKIKNTFLLLLPILLAGCSPQVTTHLIKKYPVSVYPQQVVVYQRGDKLPDSVHSSVEVIGELFIGDTGFTVDCGYDKMISLAKEETSKNGGDAFAIVTYIVPSIWGSSCHQIEGLMFYQNDNTTFDYVYPLATVTGEDPLIVETEKPAIKKNAFYANFGCAFFTSNYILPIECTGNPTLGIDYQLGYEWVGKKGFGFGFKFSEYESSYHYNSYKVKVGLTYAAPQFVMKQTINRWAFRENYGIGYFSYHEKLVEMNVREVLRGVGLNISVGVEYMLTPNIGLGIEAGSIYGILEEQHLLEDSSTGNSRVYVDLGLRFCF